MRTSRASLTLTLWLATIGCSVETAPPPVGDVGDTTPAELKVACNLSRDTILSSAQGGRRTAVERGFAWYDAQVSYSQSAYHEGYRTDCSGFVSMCWELGQSYTTANFIQDGGEWSSLGSFDELLPADAMVYRSGGSGHIVMFVGWNDDSKTEACVLEQASTAEDMQFRARTTDSLQGSGYHAIRATKFAGESDPTQQTGSGGSGGSESGCYCDAECTQNGDCCSNCSGSGGTGSGGTAGSSGNGGSGGSGCYCDSECQAYGDCCSNCSGSGGSGSGGTSGSGGSGGGQCYCDAECAQYGDCCAGCGSGGSGGSSGSGSGGSGGGACYCDAECAQYGDCCPGC